MGPARAGPRHALARLLLLLRLPRQAVRLAHLGTARDQGLEHEATRAEAAHGQVEPMTGISVKHLSSGHVHIIAASERGTVRITVTREYARKLARELLGDQPLDAGSLLEGLGDLVKGWGKK